MEALVESLPNGVSFVRDAILRFEHFRNKECIVVLTLPNIFEDSAAVCVILLHIQSDLFPLPPSSSMTL